MVYLKEWAYFKGQSEIGSVSQNLQNVGQSGGFISDNSPAKSNKHHMLLFTSFGLWIITLKSYDIPSYLKIYIF